jgi:hypothetical protein
MTVRVVLEPVIVYFYINLKMQLQGKSEELGVRFEHVTVIAEVVRPKTDSKLLRAIKIWYLQK